MKCATSRKIENGIKKQHFYIVQFYLIIASFRIIYIFLYNYHYGGFLIFHLWCTVRTVSRVTLNFPCAMYLKDDNTSSPCYCGPDI